MGRTITEKIMAKSAGLAKINPGENIWLNVDILMTHDVCGPPTFEIWEKEFGDSAKIWDENKLVVIPDHYIFTKNTQANRNLELLKNFAEKYNLPNFYPPFTEKYKGVCHIALAEEGYTIPGTVLFGTDSHTCTSGAFGLFSTGVGNTDAAFILGTGKIWERVPESIQFIFENKLPEYLTAKDLILQILSDITTDGATYQAMEFSGETISKMNMDERMTLTNMAIEAGAINGIIQADDVTLNYLSGKTCKEFEIFTSDTNAKYKKVKIYDVYSIDPRVAKPHSPDNGELARNLKNVKITKCYIGSCTGGKVTDFVNAAKILKDKKVKVNTFIIPATKRVEESLIAEKIDDKSLKQIFIESGCILVSPSCGACLGGTEDTIGRSVDNDIVISTTNRNFPGRMGSKEAEIYLASPLTVAASAITGKITDPRDYL
ncbi:MAG: 3-isopropylmalate dehydratase large subunit [Ignavibacteriales bacterium]|nr:3-isopropylmalate dehydratase large subunit [Ignavibacteriales bacterium]